MPLASLHLVGVNARTVGIEGTVGGGGDAVNGQHQVTRLQRAGGCMRWEDAQHADAVCLRLGDIAEVGHSYDSRRVVKGQGQADDEEKVSHGGNGLDGNSPANRSM